MDHPNLPPRATFTRLPPAARGQHFNALGDALVAVREALLSAEASHSPDVDDALGLWDRMTSEVFTALPTVNTIAELRLLLELRAMAAEVDEAIDEGHDMRDYRLPANSSAAVLLTAVRGLERRAPYHAQQV